MPLGCVVAVACAALWGCEANAPAQQAIELRVALSEACEPQGEVQLTLVAEGHYPAEDALFVPLRASDEPQTLPPFPGDTLTYRLEARGGDFEGAGLVSASSGAPVDVMVLPLSRVCGVATARTDAFVSGSASPLGDSELLWLGASAEAGVLRVTPSRAEVAALAGPLIVPRAAATLTATEGGAVVVGGRPLDAGDDAPALASFERFDPAGDGFEEVDRLDIARSDHAAVRAADGVVWVAGGRDAGRLLDSLERVGFGATDANLARPSDHLVLRALDDGSVVALDFARASAVSVQHFDPSGSERVDAADLPVVTAPALVVALPGARLLAFEIDEDGRTTGRACLRFDTEGDGCLDQWLTSFAGLAEARAVALRDGRALLVGERDGAATLRLVDVGRRVVEARSLAWLPRWIGMLGDGSAALVGGAEVAMLREDALSATTELPTTLLAPDAPLLALDVVDHWRWEGLELVALEAQAQVHLAAVRLSDMVLEVRADGPLDLSFGWVGDTRRVRIEAGRVDLFGSLLRHEQREDATVRIERSGERWTASVGSRHVQRTLGGLTEPARLSLQAGEAGTRVQALRIERQ